MNRLLGAATFTAAISMMAAACGGGETTCDDGETLAAINGGPEQCYSKCVDGACSAAGFSCQSGLCVSDAAANNTSTNNTSTNNTATNNTATNNTSTNNTNPTNNMTTPVNNTTGEMCATPVNLGGCEPLCQTGCLDGDACVVGSAGPNAPLMAQCQPEGTGTRGQACEMTGCIAGLVCATTTEGGAAACQEICNPAAPACSEAGANCGPLNQENTIGICVVPMDACDPLNDMCPANEKCAPTTAGNQCIAGGGKALGAACAPGECDKGLYCVDIGQGAICRQLCNPTNSMCTAPGQCNAFQGSTMLGVCI